MNKYNIHHMTSGDYSIVIPFDVELKIRALCQHNQDREWSGILFYAPSGLFRDKLQISCVDICPMDIGSSTYTEFDMNPEVVSYMTEHDLLDCEMGLIHSHDNMGTFFSSTDVATLQEEGSDRNVFVSLIVNNEGKYTAGITRKVNYKSVKTCVTHTDFNNTEVIIDQDAAEEVITEVEWYDLKVISPFEAISSEMKQWTGEVLTKKSSKTFTGFKTWPTERIANNNNPMHTTLGGYAGGKDHYSDVEEPDELFAEERATWGEAIKSDDDEALQKRVEDVVIRIITGNIVGDIKPDAKAKVKVWVSTKMVQMYNKLITDTKDAMAFFRQLCDIVLSYYLPEFYEAIDPEAEEHLVSMLINEAHQYPDNKYMSVIVDALEEY